MASNFADRRRAIVPDLPLSGLRVVELESRVATRFAGKWLAALGAEVFKIERPAAQSEHVPSARALYLDTAKKSAVFDSDKLMWLNGKRLAAKPTPELIDTVCARLEAVAGVDRVRLQDAEWMSRLIDLIKSRARTIDDLADQAVPFAADELEYEDKAIAKHWDKDPAVALERLEGLARLWADVDWTEEKLEEGLRGMAESVGIGAGKLIHPLRVALTGRMSSPGIFEVLMLLGKDRSLGRIALGIERIRDLREKRLS